MPKSAMSLSPSLKSYAMSASLEFLEREQENREVWQKRQKKLL